MRAAFLGAVVARGSSRLASRSLAASWLMEKRSSLDNTSKLSELVEVPLEVMESCVVGGPMFSSMWSSFKSWLNVVDDNDDPRSELLLDDVKLGRALR